MMHQSAPERDTQFLTLAEVGERLKLSRWRLTLLIQGGELEAIKTGSARNAHYRVSESALDDFIFRNTVRPAGQAS